MATLNLGTVKTPGVYIDEMSLFPPSVAQVDTAIPAFIGPTEFSDGTTQFIPTRIGSMAEYRRIFGGGPSRQITVSLDERNTVVSVAQGTSSTQPQYLHDSLLMYFSNGGEKCYIVSTGTYNQDPSNDGPYITALNALTKFDEPTLIVMPDATRLDATYFKNVQVAALAHCKKMQDRFAVLDVKMSTTATSVDLTTTGPAATFRSAVGTSNLEYGAAYYPYLRTSLPVSIAYPSLSIQKVGVPVPNISTLIPEAGEARSSALALEAVKTDLGHVNALLITSSKSDAFYALNGPLSNGANIVYDSAAPTSALTKRGYMLARLAEFYLSTSASNIPSTGNALLDTSLIATYGTYVTTTATALKTEIETLLGNTTDDQVRASQIFAKLTNYLQGFSDKVALRLQSAEADLRSKSTLYANIAKAAESQAVVLPPSGAIAGVYARTDGERGVWKSPANASLNYVTAPIVTVTDAEQDTLNVDAEGNGKSINAIRAFSGKGTLVWGARTLAGSSQEWRYVSVRRFFIMAEESIRKATAQFVFEANDANTWVRLRTMIENFLTLQWRAGALAGAKPEQAFFVRVGLGQTMTPQDVLDGFMIIEIGMAVVRPAEFIVLRFSHKMQQA